MKHRSTQEAIDRLLHENKILSIALYVLAVLAVVCGVVMLGFGLWRNQPILALAGAVETYPFIPAWRFVRELRRENRMIRLLEIRLNLWAHGYTRRLRILDFGAFDYSCSPDPNTEEITIMEIVVRTTDFARVLRLVQTLADRKNTVPVLGTLLIRADAKGLTITGTDMQLGGISYCPATIRAPGSVAIPAQRLAEYVRMLPDSELVLKAQTSGWVSLSCGRSRSRITTISAESFPELPKPTRDGASLSGGVLARLIEKASVAVSSESVNTNLSGALLKIETSMVSMVATDGHRLALATAPVAIPALAEPVDVLIPRKALAGFLRFAEGRNDQPVRCGVTDNHLFFVWQERLLFSRKLSGVFADYKRVLPKSHGASVSLNRNDLRGALERVAQFTESKTRCVVIEVSMNQLCVRAQHIAVGESEESLATSYAGAPARIGFNAAYLAEFLNRAEHQNVRFLFNNADTATEWQPLSEAGAPDFRYVVMPMRIN